jgi:hypothetical protein
MRTTCFDCVHKSYSYGYGICELEECCKIACDYCKCKGCDCDNYNIVTEKKNYIRDETVER